MKRIAALAILLALGLACERMYRPEDKVQTSTWKRGPVYAPWQEGLTLIYENPSLPSEQQRTDKRLQLRVSKLNAGEGFARVVHSYSNLQSPPMQVHLLLKGGGVSLEEGQKVSSILPEGFPEQVSSWDERTTHFEYLGRAAADLHGLKLPETANPVGVWVEATPLSGHGTRMRIFYLDGIGEVETLLWQKDHWECVNRLVSRGFTDVPTLKEK